MKKNILLFIGIFFPLTLVYAAFPFDEILKGFGVGKNQEITINAHGSCKKVKNNRSDYGIFVPTKTSNEWNRFQASATNVSLTSCQYTVTNPQKNGLPLATFGGDGQTTWDQWCKEQGYTSATNVILGNAANPCAGNANRTGVFTSWRYNWNCGYATVSELTCVNSYLSDFVFFRVNQDKQSDVGIIDTDMAINNNGQSCIWKAYFKDQSGGSQNYDIIHNGSVLMSVNTSTDCTNGECVKTTNKCSSGYDDQIKTAYIVPTGETDTSSAPSSSFTNSCTSSGSGNDGWDNDCDGTFDNSSCKTCCNSCTYTSTVYRPGAKCVLEKISRYNARVSFGLTGATYDSFNGTCQPLINSWTTNRSTSGFGATQSEANSNAWANYNNSYPVGVCLTDPNDYKWTSKSSGTLTERTPTYECVLYEVTGASCSNCGSYSCNCTYY